MDGTDVGVDERGRHRAPRQGLDPQGTRPCEQIEHGRPVDHVQAPEGVEERLPDPLAGRAQLAAGRGPELAATSQPGDDPHGAHRSRGPTGGEGMERFV